MARRKVVRKGLGWVLGDGKLVNVWEDAWLSTSIPLRPFGPPKKNDINLKVNDLNTIRYYLPQYEDHIRKLFPSSFPCCDKLKWLPVKSGTYTTKSFYNITQQLPLPPSMPSPPKSSIGIQTCGTSKSPPNSRHYWGRSYLMPPLSDSLALKGLLDGSPCNRCGELETAAHLFIHCPYTARVCDLAPLRKRPINGVHTTVKLLLHASKDIIVLHCCFYRFYDPLGRLETALSLKKRLI